MDDKLLQYKQIMDEQIEAYESLGELYKEKHSLLVQCKSSELWEVDSKIVSKAEYIKQLNDQRKEISKYLGDENFTMSQIIEKAKAANDEMVPNLEDQRAKLRLLGKSLSLQEKTNQTLIKHGLTMVGKTLEIIVGAFIPQANSQYDKNGQDVKSYEGLVSSIVEEA